MTAFPLLDRAPGAVLFRMRDDVRTGADFLADAAALARALPGAPWIVNCCENRYWFAVVLAAGVLRGQPNLLAGDHAPATLAALGRRHPGAIAVSERPMPNAPLPFHRLETPRRASGGAQPADNPLIGADRVAAIAFTSGTTGEPGAHIKRWGGLVRRSRAAGQRFGFGCFGFGEGAPAGIVGTVPAQHMYGFETTLLLPLHAAAASWADTVFWPADVRDALAATPQPRVLITTPLHLRALVEQAASMPPWPYPPAKIISATAPLAPALAEAAERLWNTEVFEIFGATEVGSIASRRTTTDTHWTTYPGIELRDSPSGPMVHAPFLDPHPLNDAVEHLDPTRFRLLGRGGDIVKLGGRRASHAGLNHVLTRVPGVEDGVFVIPCDIDDNPLARLTAVVVAPRRDAAAILSALRGQIDPVFLPRRIVHVEALPRNAVGKLTREALRALLDAPGGNDAASIPVKAAGEGGMISTVSGGGVSGGRVSGGRGHG